MAGFARPAPWPRPVGRPMPTSAMGGLSRLAALDFSDGFRRLREDALRRNVAFYPISPSRFEVTPDRAASSNATDQLLATQRAPAPPPNGQAIVRMNDLDTPREQLSDAVSAYYLLGYYTTNTTLDGSTARLTSR